MKLMKFLICPATDDMINATEEGELFTGKDGNEYMYEIEFDGDTVLITDTIGRNVPFDVTDIDKLMFILNRINNYVKSTTTLNQFLYDKLVEGATE